IEALARHEIGYHSDWHSRPPTIAAYLREMNWEEGAREFERREAAGARDVQRIFGRPLVCFGQPGSSWGPQLYPALKKWGVSLYLDEALHVGLPDEQPFWFAGMLHVFNLRRNTIKLEFGGAADYEQTRKLFDESYERLRERGGELISVYYHPLEFVFRGFGDVVNFGAGANTPPDKWRAPERRSTREIEAGYQYFRDFLRFVQSREQARFINASQALKLYPDRARQRAFTTAEIAELARNAQREITFTQLGDVSLSAAESFALLTAWAVDSVKSSRGSTVRLRSPYGPSRAASTETGETVVSWADFERALLDAHDFIEANDQIPSAIWMGTRHVAPEDFLATLGKVIERRIESGSPPPSVHLRAGKFTAARYAAKDSAALWDWPIFPRGFRSPKLARLAQLQTWTIKPAGLPSAE
ncbi:MAG: hypothetical protein ACREAM_12085, partial [Blastocatellia bacterium]